MFIMVFWENVKEETYVAGNPSVTGGWPRSEEERFGVKAKGAHGRGTSPVRLEP